jgi:putative FmdB family regulatory protein
MPIYDYICPKCGLNVEKLVKVSESDNVYCQNCNSKLKKTVASKMTFQLIYNPAKHKSSWGSEGYATTQRNRKVDGN